jgi:hypothetical protein
MTIDSDRPSWLSLAIDGIQCARCTAGATEVVIIARGDEELEMDLCEEHLDELISTSRPA